MFSKSLLSPLQMILVCLFSMGAVFHYSQNASAAQSVESFTKIRMRATQKPTHRPQKTHHKNQGEFEISFKLKENLTEPTETTAGSTASADIIVVVSVKVSNPTQSFSLFYKVLKGGVLKSGEIKNLMPDALGNYVTTLNIQNPLVAGHLIVTAYRQNHEGQKEGATSSFIWGPKEKNPNEVHQNSLDNGANSIEDTNTSSSGTGTTPGGKGTGTFPKGTRF